MSSDTKRVSSANPTEASELFDDDLEVVGYERSPVDVLRVAVLSSATLAVALLTKHVRDSIESLERNATSGLNAPWDWATSSLDIIFILIITIAGIGVVIVPLVTRRFRLLGYVVAAYLVAGVVMGALVTWIGITSTAGSSAASVGVLTRSVNVDVVIASQLIAAFVAVAPFVEKRWRRHGAWTVAILVVLQLIVASGESHHVVLSLLGGATVGSAVLLGFGRPEAFPRLTAIVDALRRSGVPVAELHPASVDARGSVPYFATLDDDSRVFAKVLGANQRAADLLFRIYRGLVLRNVGDERPFSSLRRTVEHEALVALQARDVGVRTPRLRCVAPVGKDSFLLCYDLIDGSSLDGVEPGRLTDDVLVGLWGQVAILRQYRIAHRDLRLANVFLATDESPWLIDFGFSEIAASETLLRNDVAQLIIALAVTVGATRSVAPAVEVLGTDAVADSLGRMQPAALSGETQSALKEHNGLLDEVRTEIERRCNVDEPPLDSVTRFRR